MKAIMAVILCAVVGCAAGQPRGAGAKAENEKASTGGSDDVTEPRGGEIETESKEATPAVVEGTFENASCGERKYNRKITFRDGGEFEAVDEVAPCPSGEECVWSGIIDWKGRWLRQGKNIVLEPSVSENERMPEKLPVSFVILSDTPLELGENEGVLVCPYSRAQ